MINMIVIFLKKYFGKAPLCNKTVSRGFSIKGFVFPLCCRCASIILSMLIFYFLLVRIKINIDNFFVFLIFSFILMLPTTIDYMHQYFTKKESSNIRRVITGIFAGFGISIILYIIEEHKAIIYIFS